MNFTSFNLKPFLTKALKNLGYVNATSVQEKVIPLILKGNKLLVRSETGSGKTHSFLIPIINNVNCFNSCQAIIISPTRELAKQTYDFAVTIAKETKSFSVKLFNGGEERSKGSTKAKNASSIIIGTPGRLADLFLRNESFDLSGVKYLVIDEADMAMDMGYLDDISALINKVNKSQILVFSATYSDRLKRELNKFLRMDKIIEVGENKASNNVAHIAIDRKHRGLNEATIDFIKAVKPYFLLVFCSKKDTVKQLYEFLISQHIECGMIHGDMEDRERRGMMKLIKNNKYQIVVCSDMAARGIDINDVSTILNYDLPRDFSFYFHRVGRTGRNGKSGEAYTFYNVDDVENIKKLQSLGVSFKFLSLNNGVLTESKISNKAKKPMSEEKAALEKEIKMAATKARTKKVKPNYKKKVRLAVEKVKRKHKREVIKKDIRRQMDERYRKEGKDGK